MGEFSIMKLGTGFMFLLVLIGGTSCDNLVTKYYSNGNIKEQFREEGNLKHGPYRSFYKSGELWIEGTYVYDTVSGRFTEYYKEGQVKLVRNYAKGLLNGARIYYSRKGEVLEYLEFKDDIPHGDLFVVDSTSLDTIEYTNFHEGKIRYKKIISDSYHQILLIPEPSVSMDGNTIFCFDTYSPIDINLLLVVGDFDYNTKEIDTLATKKAIGRSICYDVGRSSGIFQAFLMELNENEEVIGGTLIDILLEDYSVPL